MGEARSNPDIRLRKAALVFALAALVGVLVRLYVSLLGHNYDMDSWSFSAGFTMAGRSVYAETTRFNYGPVWLTMLAGLGWVHDSLDLGRLGPESFHLLVATVLSAADVAVGALLLRRLGLGPAVVFVLNPALILLSGFHSQIDTLAILPALGAWYLITPGAHHLDGAADAESCEVNSPLGWGRLLAAATLMGVSLATKHLMVLFPAWLILAPQLIGPLRRRFTFAAISWGMFALAFVPFILTESGRRGVWANVFAYQGLFSDTALLPSIAKLFTTVAPGARIGSLPIETLLKYVFLSLLMAIGVFAARRRSFHPAGARIDLFDLYLLALLVLTSAMAQQYLAIPLIVCAKRWRSWWAWFYAALATALVACSTSNIMSVMPDPPGWMRWVSTHLRYWHAQVWLVVPLVCVMYGVGGPGRNDQRTASTAAKRH